jgi:eukaryotic-like serine/threonine-protein kinase
MRSILFANHWISMTTKFLPCLLILTFLSAACQPTPIAVPATPLFASPSGTVSDTSTIAVPRTTIPEPLPSTPALTATNVGPTNKRTSPIDGMPQVYVPAGIVRMGGLDVHADERDELPAHNVSLDAFWIDQLEVTNAMYLLCVQAGACTLLNDWASERRNSYFNNEGFKDYPVVHVTWEQAGVYCAWANRRLPTEAEWERAARGDDFRNYPWGDEPPSELYANFNRLVKDTSRVGSYAAGASPFGALDMAGNVWEWVADLYRTDYYKISPELNPTGPANSSTTLRVIRGGSFQDESANLRVSKRGAALGPAPNAPFDSPDRSGEHSSKIGFRCVVSDK